MAELFSNFWWQLIIIAVLSYAFGGVNYAILFSRAIKHKDIRKVGSGNAGATNVFRVFGLRMGTLTFACDMLKGVIPCLACMFIFKYTGHNWDFEYWAGLFAVLGHIFPAFHKLRGGKGVATSIGVSFVVQPIVTACCILPVVALIFAIDRMSVISLLFVTFMTVWHWTMLREKVGIAACVFVTIMYVLVIFAHRHNIVRIFKGKEMRTGVRAKILRKDKREAYLAKIRAQAEAAEQEEQPQELIAEENIQAVEAEQSTSQEDTK